LSKSTSYNLLAENIENTHLASGGANSSKTTEQTTTFTDADKGSVVDMGAPVAAPSRSSELNSLDLARYLERPVLITDITWSEGGFLNGAFDVWSIFISNSNIADKMRTYGMFRMNLNIKVILSASPFYYGAGLVQYNPLPSYHTNPSVVVGGDQQIVTYSQRPSFWIYPQSSQGGEMTLPFFWYKEWANNPVDAGSLGTLSLHSPQPLRNANSVAGGSVTISIYAWASNVELSKPTSQSSTVRKRVKARAISFALDKDEYGDGPLSGPASAVASAAGGLTSLPYIGGLARATQIGAGAVSRVAKFFGFTNAPNIANIEPFKDMPYGGFTSSDICPATHPLALDPKTELTVDPAVVGLPSVDELNIEHLCNIHSYLKTIDWDETQTSGTLLFQAQLNPHVMQRINSAGLIWPTPVAHVSKTFNYYRMSFRVSFDVICSQYHRGRLLIIYDAMNSSIPPGVNAVTELPSYVVDIAEESHIELEFPYVQEYAYQRSSTAYDSTEEWGDLTATGNGRIFIYVQNQLTSPVASAPVGILMSASAYDVKFMSPAQPSNGSFFVAQSGSTFASDRNMSNPIVDVVDAPCEQDLVYGGEAIPSLRKLMKRHCHSFSHAFVGILTGLYEISVLQSLYPFGPNYNDDPSNLFNSAAASRVNYASHTFVGWYAPCFAGMRGSMYWAVSSPPPEDQAGVIAIISRSFQEIPPNSSNIFTTSSLGATSSVVAYEASQDPALAVANGAFLTTTQTQAGLTALIPFYDQRKFVGTHPRSYSRTYNAANSWRYSVTRAFKKDTSNSDIQDFYCAAGPDFNLHFFVGVPTLNGNGVPVA
jgi:hypothetical protein